MQIDGSFAQLYISVGIPFGFVATGVPEYSTTPLTVDVLSAAQNENITRNHKVNPRQTWQLGIGNSMVEGMASKRNVLFFAIESVGLVILHVKLGNINRWVNDI